MSEPLPCPECGEERLVCVVENCRLDDGLTVRHLAHRKCLACQTRFFDDAAMHRIQSERHQIAATRT
jgi:transcriptional regulator NrdR family protein